MKANIEQISTKCQYIFNLEHNTYNEPIDNDKKLYEFTKFDSLDKIAYMMDIEKQFNLSIPDDVIDRIATIGDLAKYLLENHDIDISKTR